jgi:hypothetical protein
LQEQGLGGGGETTESTNAVGAVIRPAKGRLHTLGLVFAPFTAATDEQTKQGSNQERKK